VKITDRIHIVASGRSGFSLTDDHDCHVYLLDGGDEYALIDAGGGRDLDGLVAQIEADGLDPRRLRHLWLTHAHGDHAAGAAGLRERFNPRVVASPLAARYIRDGDEQAISLEAARQAGIYPADFVFRACPVDAEVSEGDTLHVGDLTLEVVETPGHASGHLSFVLRHNGTTSIFSGDTLFFGGRVVLQATWDCSLQESIASIRKLAPLRIDGFFPGHQSFSLRHGHRHVEQALRSIDQLLPPPQLG
jgi:glyoxylase-like metal-dependent hydrolase (beta-lactamase superfamily II)